MMQSLDIGVVGLSVMGRSLALNMADHGFAVGGYNRSAQATQELVRACLLYTSPSPRD